MISQYHSLYTAIKCTNLYAPTYGSIDVNSTVYGSKVRYYCDHGYQLRGIEYRTCDYSGKWTGDAPVCMRKYRNTVSVACYDLS